MYYYKLRDRILASEKEYPELCSIGEGEAKACPGTLFLLNRLEPLKSRRFYSVSDPSLAFLREEGLQLIKRNNTSESNLPGWIASKIEDNLISSINTLYPNWQDTFDYSLPDKYKVHIVGLGDVGGILTCGLRLLGSGCISGIGLYDLDENKIKRWTLEAGQILPPFPEEDYPPVFGLKENEIFNCDMFVFCVSTGVPPIGKEEKDVRMAQFEGNSRIIKKYAKEARESKFKGVFAVVSDPVDLLCKVVFNESNKNEEGIMDFKGLAADQIRGFGLGVMNGRAAYYAARDPKTHHYAKEGRVFGPHGQGLIVADSIENYNDDLSSFLTENVSKANLEVRAAGFKPYIAPALSSGSLSIIAAIKGNWHYSATFMGGVYMGAKNRLNKTGTELERLDLPEPLWEKLQNTYKYLGDII